MRCESPKHPTAHPRPSDSKASYTHEKGLTRRRRLAIGFLAAAGLATAGAVLPRAPRRAHRHQGRPHGGAPPERPPSRRRRRRREGQRRGVPRREAGSAGLGVVEGPHVGERGLGGSGGRVAGTEWKRGVCSWNWNRSRLEASPRVMDGLFGWVVASCDEGGFGERGKRLSCPRKYLQPKCNNDVGQAQQPFTVRILLDFYSS